MKNLFLSKLVYEFSGWSQPIVVLEQVCIFCFIMNLQLNIFFCIKSQRLHFRLIELSICCFLTMNCKECTILAESFFVGRRFLTYPDKNFLCLVIGLDEPSCPPPLDYIFLFS